MEKIRVLATKSQQSLGQKQFDSAIGPGLHQFSGSRSCQCVEHCPAPVVIDWPPIVRIDQAVIPNLAALINVGYAGRCQFKQCLSKRIDGAETRNLLRNRKKSWNELVSRRGIQNLCDKIPHRRVPLLVWMDPARINLRFMERLGHITLNPPGMVRR